MKCLPVGDAEFQKKCLGKMREVSKGEGRTVLFVSHNMAAVEKNFVQKGIIGILQNGDLTFNCTALANSVAEYQKGKNTDCSYFHKGTV